MIELEDFAYRLRKTREDLGWSLEKLEEESGVGKSAISRYETRETEDPKYKNAQALARALGVELLWLVDGWDTKKDELKVDSELEDNFRICFSELGLPDKKYLNETLKILIFQNDMYDRMQKFRKSRISRYERMSDRM